MAIDPVVRRTGIGGSDIAKICGLSDFGDPFSCFLDKLGLLDKSASTSVQRRGKRFEKPIIEWYSERTGLPTVWVDRTIRNTERPWQLLSPDAAQVSDRPCPKCVTPNDACHICHGAMFYWNHSVDAKTIGIFARHKWGEEWSDVTPDDVSLQAHWAMSTLGLPVADVAGAFSLDELRLYRFHRDPEIEHLLLETAEPFQLNIERARDHALNGGDPMDFAPPIGATQAATDYLRQRFPRNVEALRVATEEEAGLMARLKMVGERWDVVNKECTAVENEIKLCIGDAEGLINGPWKIGYRRSKDTVGPEWSDVAQELGMRCEMLKAAYDRMIEECDKTFNAAGVKAEWPGRPDWWNQTFEQLAKAHEVVLRQGSRRLLTNWGAKNKS